MASGRMEFHADTIMQHANFSFVLPNDVTPEERGEAKHYARAPKTLILLHGLTGTDTDWLYSGAAQAVSRKYNLAVFMPTTGNSFYLDRGYAGGNFGAFIGEELPAYIRKVFGFCASREDTILGGLSMGGYGALHTALDYPETFCACIALSSALRLYDLAQDMEYGDGVMPMSMVRDIFGNSDTLLASNKNPEVQYRRLRAAGTAIPKLYLAIGTDDALLPANRQFRDFLENEGAVFRYEEGPGAHDWTFWNEYIDRGLASILN